MSTRYYSRMVGMVVLFGGIVAGIFGGNVSVAHAQSQTESRDPRIIFEQGDRAFVIKNYDLAIENYSKVIEIDPKFEYAYFNRAYAKHKKGDHKAAIEDFNKTLEVNPKNPAAFSARGDCYSEIGK